MYIIVSTSSADGSIHHYGTWRSAEAARIWGINFHGGPPRVDFWEIVEINRVN